MRLMIFIKIEVKKINKLSNNKLINNNKEMLERIKDLIFENKNAILYSLLGASVFSGYFFYGRHELAEQHGVRLRNKKNKLDTTFE